MNYRTKLVLATLMVITSWLLVRAAFVPTAVQAQAPHNQLTQPGRYQLTASDGTLFFADTATGQVWQTAARYDGSKREWVLINSPVAPGK